MTIRVRRSAVAMILGLFIATLSACSSKTAPASVQDGAPGGRDGGTGNLPDTTTDLPSADLPSATNGCARTLVVCNGLCLAQGQVAGNCTALLGNDTPPTTMAVTGTHLYYAVVGDSAVLRVPTGGGAVETVTSGSSTLVDLALDAANVTFLTIGGGSLLNGAIWRAPLAGGSPQRIHDMAGDSPAALAVDATSAYWVGLITGGFGTPPAVAPAVHRVLLTGAAAVEVANASDPRDVVLDDTAVFWIDHGVIWKTSKSTVGATPLGDGGTSAGGAVQVVDTGGTSVVAMVLDGEFVYWTASSFRGLFRAPKAGGAAEKLADTDQSGSLAIDATDIYLATLTGNVVRFHRANAALTTIATIARNASMDVVADATSVFVSVSPLGSTSGGAGILRITQ